MRQERAEAAESLTEIVAKCRLLPGVPVNILVLSGSKYRWPMIWLCVVFCLMMIACSWYTGPVPQVIWGHDIFIMLEGGWKWKWGIYPHRDYYSYLGWLVPFLTFLGMKVGGNVINAMPTAICLFSIFILPACIYVTFTRMPAIPAFLSAVALIGTALAPYPLGCSIVPLWFGYAEIYNRWAYCLFIIAVLAISVVPNDSMRWKEILDGTLAGTITVLRMFIKISFGLLLPVAFLAFSLVHTRRRTNYYLAAIGSSILMVAAFGFWMNWDFGAVIRDMSIAGHARRGLDITGFFDAIWSLSGDICVLVMLGILDCIAAVVFTAEPIVKTLVRIPSLILGYVLFSVALVMTNAPMPRPESPLLAIASVILLCDVIRNCGTSGFNPKTHLVISDRMDENRTRTGRLSVLYYFWEWDCCSSLYCSP
jgi:hypothetical protein